MSSFPTEMEMRMEQEKPLAETPPPSASPEQTLNLKVLVPLTFAVAAMGVGTGYLGASFTAPRPKPQADAVAPEVHHTGSYAIAVQETKPTVIEAIALVDPGAASPQNPSQLRDAILGLLTEAAALPLVQQADDGILMLERSTMAMASETAPWLAGLDLVAASQ